MDIPDQAAVARRTGAVAGSLDPAAVAYLDVVRTAAGRLGRRELDPADARGALEELRALASIDTDVPILSRRPALRYLKGGVKQLGGWYLRYVAAQVTAFGTATVAFGAAIDERVEALGTAQRDLAGRLEQVEGRLARLERTGT